MNGAIAELLARTNKTPTSTSVMTIGASQYFLFSRMNCHNSLTTCTFDIRVLSKHLFVVTRILLSLGVWPPVGVAALRTTMERIPTHCPFYQTDRRQDAKENDC